MQSSNQLQDMLHSINRKSYPAYKSLKGAYQFNKYVLSIDHVQGDPFASPSHISGKRLWKKWTYFCDQMRSGGAGANGL